VCDVGQLVRRYAKLLRENLPVARRLIEHIDEVGIFKLVLSRCFVQFPKKIPADVGL
jgi:hypothetical protein